MADPKSDPKEGDTFFRRVARFVSNPTTDWAEINSRQDDPEADLAKAELKAMVERKRRNDFVRKRELDMLRRIRREGLSPDQLAALGSAPNSSKLDDGERVSEPNSKMDLGVKAKIDEIEQQMVGESFATTQAVGGSDKINSFFNANTRPSAFAPQAADVPRTEPKRGRVTDFASAEESERLSVPPPPAAVTMASGMAPLSDAPPSRLPELPPLEMSLSFAPVASAPPNGLAAAAAPAAAPAEAMEVQEVVHDPELDEAVIAFANADYETSERSLTDLVKPGGGRHEHAETWLVLFDHYRATGAQGRFEALAVEYAQQFHLSSPQWFSMPKLVAETMPTTRASSAAGAAPASNAGWTAPATVTLEDVELLRKRTESLPLPWVFEWSAFAYVEPEAVEPLKALLRGWANQAIDQTWLGGETLLRRLQTLTPVGDREVDPALWMLRLEALRVANRPDHFDETAIDYCVTYEVSPPSWERVKCRVRVSGSGQTMAPVSTMQSSELHSTHFAETSVGEGGAPTVAHLELRGQLAGDISELLKSMMSEVGDASLISISCDKLIRLDFMAAGDLLNWVFSRRSENRAVQFVDAHRLVALFFGAMGINEQARVKVRIN